jgi:hypothetical protein
MARVLHITLRRIALIIWFSSALGSIFAASGNFVQGNTVVDLMIGQLVVGNIV